MLKKFTQMLVIVGLHSMSFAQVKYGLKVGIAQSRIKESLASSYQDMNFKTGIQVGAMADIPLIKNISLRPALQFTQKGYRAIEGNVGGPFYWNRNWSITYLELPVEVLYNIPVTKTTSFFIASGAIVSVGLSGKGKGVIKGTDGTGQLHTQESSGNEPFKTPGYKRIDLGADFSTGIQFKKIIITAAYNYGILNILDYDHGIQTTKNRSFAFTAGYFISNH